LGVRKIKKLYDELGIKNLADLEKAAKDSKIAPLLDLEKKQKKIFYNQLNF